jgi:hypothetical protein
MKIVMYFILLVILFIASLSCKEGFESGQYAYLAPNPVLVVDEPTKNNFITAGKKTATLLFPEITVTDKITQLKNELDKTTDLSLDEINYYIQNNKWPYGPYIMNYLTVNKEDLLNKLKNTKTKTLEDLQKVFPTRFIYRYLIAPTETQISPLPLSNDIFMGRKEAPVEAAKESAKEPEKTIRPPFSSDNYTKLQSICSTLK